VDVQALVDRLAPGARVIECRPLTGGVSAEVQAVTFVTPGGVEEHVVVRRHRPVEGKADRAERAAREHALLGVLHAAGLPVPRSRLFAPPHTLVLDLMPGDSTLPPNPERPVVADALAAALAGIHAVDRTRLPALPSREDPLPELRDWLPDLASLGAAAERCGPFAGPPRLLHGDFWPGNVLWHHGRLAAVLDWEDAALGDPLSDLACARLELACAASQGAADAFTGAYFRHARCPQQRLPLWDLYVSTAADRYMDGWGLAPDVLAARRATTRVWQTRALRALGLN
jgi:aminoglycoside phosphotransferase (APT) family kinase protein